MLCLDLAFISGRIRCPKLLRLNLIAHEYLVGLTKTAPTNMRGRGISAMKIWATSAPFDSLARAERGFFRLAIEFALIIGCARNVTVDGNGQV